MAEFFDFDPQYPHTLPKDWKEKNAPSVYEIMATLNTLRIISSGMIPASSVLQPSTATSDIKSALQSCWQIKNTQITLYLEAIKHCLSHSLVDDNKLFNTILQEEQEQLIQIQTLLQKL